MRYLLETFCLLDGYLLNLSYHQERVNSSLQRDYNITHFIQAIKGTQEFVNAQNGKWRVSVTYSENGIESVRFIPYTHPMVSSLCPVEIKENFYKHKWADRTKFDEIKRELPKGVEPLFILDGQVTDTSFTNVVLEKEGELYTPRTYLLKGTKRSLLLDNSLIKEREVTYDSLALYDKVHLINAMLNPNELVIDIR